eukprot:TRINITY_DN39046_c0_g1_i1.p1 TRINITY_DN39046_c0_g1~~TRINITY_DN39046_c0_g1_i1.p1  ORF type:complete len:432 (-),score=80.01 TRINITY_DN39046_c0_g1_i1:36-1172(-)
MEKPIDPDVRRKILEPESVETIIQTWLRRVKRLNETYKECFGVDGAVDVLKKRGSFIGIPLRENLVMEIYDKLTFIRGFLQRDADLTHAKLFSRIQPGLSHKYKSSSADRGISLFNKMFGKIYDLSQKERGHGTIVDASEILASQNIPYTEHTLNQVLRGEKFSPDNSQQELAFLHAQSRWNEDPNFLSDAQLSRRLEKIRFSEVKEDEVDALIGTITRKERPRELLCIAKLESWDLTAKRWSSLFDADTLCRLHFLSLRGARGLTPFLMQTLAKYGTGVEVLDLSDSGIPKLCGEDDTNLVFKSLEELYINECSQLEFLALQAPLKILEAKSCPLLRFAKCEGSALEYVNLKRSGCSVVTFAAVSEAHYLSILSNIT